MTHNMANKNTGYFSRAPTISVMVTGHRGYIGSALVQFLSSIRFINRIIGYDISDGNDILDYNNLINVMKSNDIDLVIHLAALSCITSCNENPRLAIRMNAIGTRNILNAMKECGCNNIIYASTSSVYGNKGDLPYSEDMHLFPCSIYGISKLLGEHAIYNHYELKGNPGSYLIFRMFNVVGSSGFNNIDSNVNPGYDRLFTALQSGNITIYGKNYPTLDGTCERDYVSLKDVCQAYINGIIIMMSKREIRSTINICSGDTNSVKRIIYLWNLTRHLIQHKSPRYEKSNLLPYVNYTYGSRRKGDPYRIYGSNEKAFKVIRWKPKRKIENIIFDLSVDKKF